MSDILRRHNVKIAGSGSRTMMPANGVGCDPNMWRRVAPAFQDSFSILLFDHRRLFQAHDELECPAPESGQIAGTLREPPAQIKDAGDHLGRGGENEIAEVSAANHANHPGAARSEIVNALVTAYCPRINQ